MCTPRDDRSDSACGVPPVDASAPAKQQAEAQVARALRFVDLLRMDDAKRALDEAAADAPFNLTARLLRARLAAHEGRGIEALAEINAALSLAPDNAQLLANRAFLECDPETMSESRSDADRAVQLDPDDPDIRYVRSTVSLADHKLQLAFTDLSFALAKDPNHESARRSRAQLLLIMQKYPAAIHDATALLESQPWDVVALQVRARASVALGDDAAALKDFDVLVGPSPQAAPRQRISTFLPDVISRAGVLVRLNRTDEARDVIGTLLSRGDVRTLLHMQLYLHANGFPNVEITGKRSDAFDTALVACFADQTCGPHIRL